MSYIKTVNVLMPSEAQMRELIDRIIAQSQWFAVAPMPDDHWQVTIKREAAHLFKVVV